MNKLMLGSREVTPVLAKGNQFKLFQHQWFDYEINDMSWLRADTFSWQDGTVYSNAYNHLVADIDGVSSTTETIGSYTITFYRASDGHKIVLADQETTVSNIYTATGVAWYYVLDTVNNRFKLPRTKYGFDGLRGNVGDYISESLPNFQSKFPLPRPTGDIGSSNFENVDILNGVSGDFGVMSTTSGYTPIDITIKGSNSSSTYQDSAPVQQRATQQYLYFYVGQFSQSAIEQTAGYSQALTELKADKDLTNSPYTANRILEIPQNLSVVADGYTVTITGKATKMDGSQIDVNITRTLSGYGTVGKKYVLYGPGDGDFSGSSLSGQWWIEEGTIPVYNQASQPSVTSQYDFWFDTTNTKLKFTSNTGSTWNEIPLPYCEIELTSSGWKVTNVFNGFGYVDSTTFALPMKGQATTAINDDGTVSTTIWETTTVQTLTVSSSGSVSMSSTGVLTSGFNKVGYTKLADVTYYNSRIQDADFYGVAFVANSNASNFSQAGRSLLSGLGMPSSKYSLITNSAASSTSFTAPSNGYFRFRGFASSAGTFSLFMVNWSNGLMCGGRFYAIDTWEGVNIIIPVKKGHTVQIQYENCNIAFDASSGLWFVPCEGEV